MPFWESFKGIIWKFESLLFTCQRIQNGMEALQQLSGKAKLPGGKKKEGTFILVRIWYMGHHYSRKKKQNCSWTDTFLSRASLSFHQTMCISRGLLWAEPRVRVSFRNDSTTSRPPTSGIPLGAHARCGTFRVWAECPCSPGTLHSSTRTSDSNIMFSFVILSLLPSLLPGQSSSLFPFLPLQMLSPHLQSTSSKARLSSWVCLWAFRTQKPHTTSQVWVYP